MFALWHWSLGRTPVCLVVPLSNDEFIHKFFRHSAGHGSHSHLITSLQLTLNRQPVMLHAYIALSFTSVDNAFHWAIVIAHGADVRYLAPDQPCHLWNISNQTNSGEWREWELLYLPISPFASPACFGCFYIGPVQEGWSEDVINEIIGQFEAKAPPGSGFAVFESSIQLAYPSFSRTMVLCRLGDSCPPSPRHRHRNHQR